MFERSIEFLNELANVVKGKKINTKECKRITGKKDIEERKAKVKYRKKE